MKFLEKELPFCKYVNSSEGWRYVNCGTKRYYDDGSIELDIHYIARCKTQRVGEYQTYRWDDEQKNPKNPTTHGRIYAKEQVIFQSEKHKKWGHKIEMFPINERKYSNSNFWQPCANTIHLT